MGDEATGNRIVGVIGSQLPGHYHYDRTGKQGSVVHSGLGLFSDLAKRKSDREKLYNSFKIQGLREISKATHGGSRSLRREF